MEHLKKLKNIKVEEWLFYLLVFSLFFPIRKVLDFGTSNLLGQQSDFTSVSLYLSDLIIIVLLIVEIAKKKISIKLSKISIFLFFLIIISFLANFQFKSVLLWYGLIKSLELIILFEVVKQYFGKQTDFITKILNFALILGFFKFL